jgi:8-oxo-dGTP pyrophosphatase MutT (NUDIX family)
VKREMPQVLRQSAVIPVSDGRVCMVTSSSGRRWVIPKGMIDPGHTAGEAALLEAWEEAGLVGVLAQEPVGSYLYDKYGRPHHVTVFVMTVTEVADVWPESDVRRREWLDADEAVDRIEEPGLREIVAATCRSPLAA